MQRIDLTGKKFNRWNVIKYEGNQNYLCKCDCGIEKIVNGQSVKKGKTKSCGCYRDEKKSLTSTKVELICQYCNQKFNISPCHSNQKFCSVKCKANSTYQKRKCLICEKEFILSKKSKKLYCSQKCANIPKIEKLKERACRKKYTCNNCGIENNVLLSIKRKDFKFLFCSITCKVEYRKKNKKIECLFCKDEFLPIRSTIKFCSKNCAYEWRKCKTKLNPGSWLENGYRVIYTSDGKGIKEHRKVMEEYLGRELKKSEAVHHINGNKEDNRIENLMIMTHSEHSKLHREKDKRQEKSFFGRPIEIKMVKSV